MHGSCGAAAVAAWPARRPRHKAFQSLVLMRGERMAKPGARSPLNAIGGWIADFGGRLIDLIAGLGGMTRFSLRVFGWMLGRWPQRETLVPNAYQIGVLSLPVIGLTGTFIGMVLVEQSYVQFRNLHLEAQLGAVINFSLVRELGPVLAATMLAGRVGSAMAAELGTMRVTEQIDALASDGRQSDPLSGRAPVPWPAWC